MYLKLWKSGIPWESRILSIAEETLREFLSKATETAVEWIQILGMKIEMATEYKLIPDIKPGQSGWTIKTIVSEKCSPNKALNSALKYQHIWLMDPTAQSQHQ
ncbi:unnamed protein product [Fraxinus pennsylvanica]|uniref:Uncharacterized protein n=1 Tax=Fraxinus pennsylvanica TaxID=56036 RepID=A0AAD2E6X9_9LAMI|nr:unnamed protein product [Fraxinus pennsylvanica]